MDFTKLNYAQQFDMAGMFPIVDVTTEIDVLVRPGERTLILDFLDQKYVNLLNGIRQWTTRTYTGQKFSTLCNDEQGTTSLWNLNLAFNGLVSCFQLQPGMQLRFPLLTEVQRMITILNAPQNIGRTVTL